jgi:ABC-type amino acid transport substrate-binding protein
LSHPNWFDFKEASRDTEPKRSFVSAVLARAAEISTPWFVRDRPRLKVVETGITVERLGICVRKGDTALRDAIGAAQAGLAADGTLAALVKQWLGAGATLPS